MAPDACTKLPFPPGPRIARRDQIVVVAPLTLAGRVGFVPVGIVMLAARVTVSADAGTKVAMADRGGRGIVVRIIARDLKHIIDDDLAHVVRGVLAQQLMLKPTSVAYE